MGTPPVGTSSWRFHWDVGALDGSPACRPGLAEALPQAAPASEQGVCSDHVSNIVHCFIKANIKYLLFRLASVLFLHNCSTVYFISDFRAKSSFSCFCRTRS